MKPVDLMKQLVHYRTYAKTLDNGLKETREQTINRCRDMHIGKFPDLKEVITGAFEQVHLGRVVPSMRTLQFGGDPVIKTNARAYNCAFAALTSWRDFSDLFYLLMCGTGTGYSVQKHHIARLPSIIYDKGVGNIFIVEDSKEGWCDTLYKILTEPCTELDVHLVRRKGSPLSSGGTASGPEALLKTIAEIKAILRRADGRKLRPIECHDIMCHIANGVVVGGVRRAALACIFDVTDTEMLTCKHGLWYETNPQRARANNSAVILRSDPSCEKQIRNVMQAMFDSNAGEPGVFLSNNKNLGTNPCYEISLKDGQLCNLSEINVAACDNKEDFIKAAKAATLIGTLQAAYTDFTYLQPKWKMNCEEEALLGVSLTGQAQKWLELTSWLTPEVSKLIKDLNKKIANELGIKSSARITTTKPSGSTSTWLGTTSGIHAAHSEYYIRRIRVDVGDPVAPVLKKSKFVEVDSFNKENLVVSIPIAAPDAITRKEETAIELMERAKLIYEKWIACGHNSGDNTHNVSLTVSYKSEEKEDIVDWMVENKDNWAGIAFLPYDGGSYTQAPFEEITEDVYRLLEGMFDIEDLSQVDYTGTIDERLGELACQGGACEIS